MNMVAPSIYSDSSSTVAIIGAGPYGLAAAAHLRAANVPFRMFGNALSFWRDNMPVGMKLRSPWVATHIADPGNRHTLDVYYKQAGMDVPKLLPVENFVGYGEWFAQRIAPDLDTRVVRRVEARDGGFRLVLEDGDTFFAQRVVMAVGLLGHEYRPAQFDGLPRDLVSHSCEHTDSERYRGKRVAVIGRGQSACEAAALLHEAGADVEIICRGNLVWNADPVQRSSVRKAVRAMLGSMLIPPSQVGPFPYNWVNETPGVIHRFSQVTRDRWNELNLRATAILWLRPRLVDVPVDQGRTIFAARQVGKQVSLTLDTASKKFDHVMLATGYRIDVDKMAMLEPKLRENIARYGGLPFLSGGFESSIPGLHFVGASAVGSFGPLLRFIAGAGYAARRVTRAASRAMARASGRLGAFAEPMPVIAEREHS
ncbi:MAG TPA: NAD(P)-binding domain-containing protein [Pseudolabrys sp.]|nr:NAD(P)-binding domain-containing protein [Pseudolabrys sp.]